MGLGLSCSVQWEPSQSYEAWKDSYVSAFRMFCDLAGGLFSEVISVLQCVCGIVLKYRTEGG